MRESPRKIVVHITDGKSYIETLHRHITQCRKWISMYWCFNHTHLLATRKQFNKLFNVSPQGLNWFLNQGYARIATTWRREHT
jgi:hypothetical protein